MEHDSITAIPTPAIITQSDLDSLGLLPESLYQRIGHAHATKRLSLEGQGEQPAFTSTGMLDSLENRLFSTRALTWFLKASGLYTRGRRNARNIQIRQVTHQLDGLPPQLRGYTLLHLSDLHIDISPDFVEVVIQGIQDLHYDLIVLTGDYRFSTAGPSDSALDAMGRLAAQFASPSYAVLGNHDSLHMVAGLESAGIQVLLNESHEVAEDFFLAGVDDPHYFKCDDLPRALKNVPNNAVRILLAHSPEIYAEANAAEMDLLLCGHTHGGQIRLPGGIPLTLNADCPRRYGSGPWQHQNLRGYTSVGTGSSLLDVRLNCLPEVTLHRLVAD